MNIEQLIHSFEKEDMIRSVEVQYDPFILEIDIPEEEMAISSLELNKLIINELQNNLEQVFDHMNFTLLPEDTLNTNTAYIGRLVRHVETKRLGVITKINRQLIKKPLIVQYSDGTLEKATYFDFLIEKEYPREEIETFTHLRYTNNGDVVDGGVYFVEGYTFTGLSVVRYNGKTHRASISRLSTNNKREADRMSFSDLVLCLYRGTPHYKG